MIRASGLVATSVIVMGVGASACKASGGERPNADAGSVLSTQAIYDAAADGSTMGAQDAGSDAAFVQIPVVDFSEDFAEILRAYKSNQVRADAKYKGKRVRVFGPVGDIRRDLSNAIYVTIGDGSSPLTPILQAFFKDDQASGVAVLSKGRPALVDCTGQGVEPLTEYVQMVNCSLPQPTTMIDCFALRKAGLAVICSEGTGPDEQTLFYTKDPERMSASEHGKLGGVIQLLVSDERVDRAAKKLEEHPDLGASILVGHSSRVWLMLPKSATPDYRRKVQAVIDGLPPEKSP